MASTQPGWTYFSPLELAGMLAPLVALATAAGLYGQSRMVEAAPQWFSPTDFTGSADPMDFFRGGLQVGVLTGLLCLVAGCMSFLPLRFTRGVWLPTWMLPLSGRWLKLLALAIVPYCALFWGIQQHSLWACVVSGISLCLLLWLLLWDGLFYLPEIDAYVAEMLREAWQSCPFRRRNGTCR